MKHRFGPVLAVAVIVSGCASEASFSEFTRLRLDTTIDTQDDADATPICDPFDPGSSSGNHGLYGRMSFIPQTAWSSFGGDLKNFWELSTPIDAPLVLSRAYVPTRVFSDGFENSKGEKLTDSAGNVLFEYFGVRLSGQLAVEPSEAGFYEFALLADDGSILSLGEESGTMVKVVDNDGLHPPRLGCSAGVVKLEAGKPRPLKLEYYQGPRYRIALVLVWRKLADLNGDGSISPIERRSEIECGQQGHDLLFDSTQAGSPPTSRWTQFLSRGWQVVPTQNLLFPQEVTSNPCLRRE